MRETLHQLTLTLALPIAVIAVWSARGEPAASPVRETAIAYRVELLDLPLPTRERLRTPGLATDWRTPRVTPEEPTPRSRRPLLPEPSLSAPPPLDLAVDADSDSELAAQPSPRAVHGALGAVPRAPQLSLRAAPALVAAVSPLAVRRGATVSTPATSTVPATASAVGAPTATRKPVATEPVADAVKSASKPTRVAALEPASGFSSRDLRRPRGREPVSVPDRVRRPENLSPIVTRAVGIDPGRREKFETADDYSPLTPTNPLEDLAHDLSWAPDSQQPLDPVFDLPLPVVETAEASSPVDLEHDLSATPVVFHWPANWRPVIVPIPEPGSALLLGAALAALGAARRSRRRA